MRILVTGAEGLVGKALCRALLESGVSVIPFDIRHSVEQDVRRMPALAAALGDVAGIVHLAAMSRIAWAERWPVSCREINEGAFSSLVGLCAAKQPWLIFASSREVYGPQAELPVSEDAVLNPINAYARSKVFGEQLVGRARSAGIVGNIVRLSNVYGSTTDHSDRVVPAFARAAALGGVIRVEGADSVFDFTHITDVTLGLMRLIELTAAGHLLDPIHLVTGAGTSLGELAQLAAHHARKPVSIEQCPARSFDVSSFIGSPARAAAMLSWSARVDLRTGLKRLIEDFAKHGAKTDAGNWQKLVEDIA